jgi:hypothetical protein
MPIAQLAVEADLSYLVVIGFAQRRVTRIFDNGELVIKGRLLGRRLEFPRRVLLLAVLQLRELHCRILL